MLFLALLCIFGVAAGDSVCPDIKGVDNVDEDSFFEDMWYMQFRIEDTWENKTNCNCGSFNPKDKAFTISNVKDHEPNSFGGTYVFDKDLGVLKLTSTMYEETIGVSDVSLNIVYYDNDSFVCYACSNNNGCMTVYSWACTRSRIIDENEKKKLQEQMSKLDIDTSQIVTIDHSEETCGAN